MIWETVKQRVAGEVHAAIAQGRTKEADVLLDLLASDFAALKELPPEGRWRGGILAAYADKAKEVILQWDVRGAGRLRELFPWAFPPSLRNGRLVAGYDARDRWVVTVM